MNRKHTLIMAAAFLTLGINAVSAQPTSNVIGAIKYEAMRQQEMARITGEGGNIGGNVENWRRNPSVSSGTKIGGSTGDDVTIQGAKGGIASGGEA